MRGNAAEEMISMYRERYIKLLDFRHFERHIMFSQSDRERETDSRIGSKKAISDGVNVSVVMEL